MSNVERLTEAIKERDAERVFIQIPEGLRTRGQEILDALDGEGIDAFLSMEPCFGACDLRDAQAERLDCDLLVNVGHSDFGVDEKIPTLYFHWEVDADPVPALENDYGKIKEHETIGLIGAINFLHLLDDIGEWLGERGHRALIGEGSLEPGQILGCNVSSALVVEGEIDALLFVGSGHFHPLGTGLETDVPFYVMDLEKGTIEQPDYDLFERQRYAAIAEAGDAERFGILVSEKPGQHFVDPFQIKERLEEKGREAWVLTMDFITEDKLRGIDVDAYVNTACPRIGIEDRGSFEKPVLNPDEFAEMMRNLEEKREDKGKRVAPE